MYRMYSCNGTTEGHKRVPNQEILHQPHLTLLWILESGTICRTTTQSPKEFHLSSLSLCWVPIIQVLDPSTNSATDFTAVDSWVWHLQLHCPRRSICPCPVLGAYNSGSDPSTIQQLASLCGFLSLGPFVKLQFNCPRSSICRPCPCVGCL